MFSGDRRFLTREMFRICNEITVYVAKCAKKLSIASHGREEKHDRVRGPVRRGLSIT